jgi:hypothetical protein
MKLGNEEFYEDCFLPSGVSCNMEGSSVTLFELHVQELWLLRILFWTDIMA